MDALANSIRLQFNSEMKPEIIIGLLSREPLQHIDELYQHIQNGKTLDVQIKKHRQKRSLNANAYLWVLLAKMADVLHTSKDELYLQILEKYGQFTHIVVRPCAVDRMKKEWRTLRELGLVNINGVQGVQLQCYYGSSTYDSKEFSVLLEGVISECKEIGIETLPKDEITQMLKEWGEEE